MTIIVTHLKRLEGAYAPNTIRSYLADVTGFVDWCSAKSIQPFPISDDVLAEYTRSHAQKYKFSTLHRKIIGLRRVNKLMGFDDIPYSNDQFLELRRMRRAQYNAPRQAFGINRPLLLRMIDAQPNTQSGHRNRALISLGYDFLARRSELVALRRSDIEFTQDGALRGIIRRSKSDQFGRGRLVYGSERSAKLLEKWLRHLPNDIDWIFCSTVHGRYQDRPMSDRSVNNILKKAIVRTRGERPRDTEISGHSLRVGAAQDLLKDGHDIAAIMRAGGWRDVGVVSQYLRLAEHNIWEDTR